MMMVALLLQLVSSQQPRTTDYQQYNVMTWRQVFELTGVRDLFPSFYRKQRTVGNTADRTRTLKRVVKVQRVESRTQLSQYTTPQHGTTTW
jgi:hypothetical protein